MVELFPVPPLVVYNFFFFYAVLGNCWESQTCLPDEQFIDAWTILIVQILHVVNDKGPRSLWRDAKLLHDAKIDSISMTVAEISLLICSGVTGTISFTFIWKWKLFSLPLQRMAPISWNCFLQYLCVRYSLSCLGWWKGSG